MKCAPLLVLWVLALFAVEVVPANAATLRASPVTKVLTLLRGLKSRVETDGLLEQKSYDKFACWCSETLGRKAQEMAAAKETMEKLQTLITKLKGELGAHGAEVEQLKKDIAANLESQRDATDVREKETGDYEAVKTESEQCIGALESAIGALTGAGAGKKAGFMETLQEAKLLSVAQDVKRVLQRAGSRGLTSHLSPERDLVAVHNFIEHPEAFVANSRRQAPSSLSLLGQGQNPFGDYAPQSTQIQGILKSMYDSFVGDLEKANAEEATQHKSFLELMATKKAEEATLTATLAKQEFDLASKNKIVADSREELHDTTAQLEADEVFFDDTKVSCKAKAGEWAERSRMRSEELTGMNQALEILGNPDNSQIFTNASTTFVQLSSSSTSSGQGRAYSKLKSLAQRYRSLGLAQVAAEAKMGGHFGKVLTMIDHMIQILRKEEQDDIAHRDRCQGSVNKNTNDMEDLSNSVDKAKGDLIRMGDVEKELLGKLKQLELDMKATQNDLEERTDLRNKEHADFKQALKDDTDAIALIQQAIVALSKFYKNNRIPLSILQGRLLRAAEPEPEYTVDPDKAPDTVWDSDDSAYGGRSHETRDVVSMLSMIVEDLQKEIKTGRADDADAEKRYETDRAALESVMHAQKEAKVMTEKELADLQAAISDKTEHLDGEKDELTAQQALESTLGHECSWVKTHFDSRREKRKAELAGLQEAKSLLAGAEAGDYDELALAEGSDST